MHLLATRSDGLWSGDIVKELGLAKQTVIRHLTALETEGIVTADHPADQRRGARVRYSLDKEALTEQLEAHRRFVLGED